MVEEPASQKRKQKPAILPAKPPHPRTQAALRHVETIAGFWENAHSPADVSMALDLSVNHVSGLEEEDRHWLFSHMSRLSPDHPLNESRNFPLPVVGGTSASIIRQQIRIAWTHFKREERGQGRW
ncbi:hypothetical protein HYV43_04075 [Candidatus Micrarchaeota archaeon]|nr:hypothetical protein [Candidatus Micrarchaeota archaeon]